VIENIKTVLGKKERFVSCHIHLNKFCKRGRILVKAAEPVNYLLRKGGLWPLVFGLWPLVFGHCLWQVRQLDGSENH
jgi:hypothetical protein